MIVSNFLFTHEIRTGGDCLPFPWKEKKKVFFPETSGGSDGFVIAHEGAIYLYILID